VIVLILALPALEASGALAPLNDLLAVGQGSGQKPEQVASVRRAEPPLVATPRALRSGVQARARDPGAGPGRFGAGRT